MPESRRSAWSGNLVPIILTAALAWIGSLFAATVAARYEFKAQTRDAEARIALQSRQDAAAFRLAAAQLVMNQPNCGQALTRAALLRALFPKQLGDRFAAPVQLTVGRYTFSEEKQSFVPVRNDKSGCTVRKDVPISALPKGQQRLYRQVWGTGKGVFRTRGRYASATVRG
jgi:hypothetical protein